ncbi:MAG: E2 ligase fold family C protein [Gaiellaceae bacterium]
MALADYYERAALAAAHALTGGFEGTQFRQRLEETPVGIALDGSVSSSREGRVIADLTVRLLARLYPTLSIVAADGAADEGQPFEELARRINPSIEITSEPATLGVAIGSSPSPFSETIFVGSQGWDAYVSTAEPQPLGDSPLPYGAGAAACLACANLFRRIFTDDWPQTADESLVFSTFDLTREPTLGAPQIPEKTEEPVVLVGLGAIGNAAAWALSRTPLLGELHLIDGETVELSNLQRYVLALRENEGDVKVTVASALFERAPGLTAQPQHMTWAEFASLFGYAWPRVLLALDSAADRRSVQASLPRWIANSWTQPGDLGVSIHPAFTEAGACVSCLYLQDQVMPNQDELYAAALGIPEMIPQVRQFLHTGEGLPPPFLDLIAERLEQPPPVLGRFVGRPIRELYIEGICGGAVLPLGAAGVPDASLHVPLAHQSALAGVLLAAAYMRSISASPFAETRIVRLDLLRQLAGVEPLPTMKKGDRRCICEDADYRNVYLKKWSAPKPRGRAKPKPSPSKTRPGGSAASG